MNAFADHSAVPAAGGRGGQCSVIFAQAKSGSDCVHVGAPEAETAAPARYGFRAEPHAGTASHVPPEDTLRARELAVGQSSSRHFPWDRLPAPLPGAERPAGP
ncbi:hypothetical protein AB0L74_06660 [Streptomyces sp. NPDC052020]|uniref:hypothetical protein n=1 Tax=Streptomyces sp. NPDC052020 TaxID=3155677 RepID=UPI00343D9960